MDIFSVLAEPTRRQIVEMLAVSGTLSATDIFDKFKTSPPAISQHLKVLREAQVVQVEKRAQKRLYHINPEAIFELENWIEKMKAQWNERYDKLDEVILQEKKKQKNKRDLKVR